MPNITTNHAITYTNLNYKRRNKTIQNNGFSKEFKEPLPVNIKQRPTVKKNRPPFYFMKRIPMKNYFRKWSLKGSANFIFREIELMSTFAETRLGANAIT